FTPFERRKAAEHPFENPAPCEEPLMATVDERERIAAGFVRFADETRGASPLYTLLTLACARDHDLIELLLAAPGAQRRPNLLFACVQDLLLAGEDHSLREYYPSVVSNARVPGPDVFEA